MKIPVLLFIEDDAQTNKALNNALAAQYKNRYRIKTAESGEAGLEIVARCLYDKDEIALFLVQQNLPGISGTAFLSKAAENYPAACKVLVSDAEDTLAAVTAVNEIGVDRYLVKPLEEAALFSMLDSLLGDWSISADLPYLHVQDIMTVRSARIREDANLHDAARIVALSGVSDLMVVDMDGKFTGVLSEGDILRAALPDFDEIVEEGGTLFEAYQLFLRKGRDLSDNPIAPLVIREPITLAPEDHVAKAAVALVTRQIRNLPVVKDDRLLGTVSRADICEAVVGII